MAAVNGASITCVDASGRMLAQARAGLQRLGVNSDRIDFVHADALEWYVPSKTFDLIVTHFFLDCFGTPQVGNTVAKLAQAAAPNAIWLLADFSIPKAGFARSHARAWLAVMYWFFRCVAGIEAHELVDPSPFLRVEGFALERQHLFRHGMLKSELWRKQ